MFSKRRAWLVLACHALIACGDGDGDPEREAPLFPADYAANYQEVRNCRQSGDHDLNRVRILADPAAYSPYMLRDAPFPIGAVVLKEEYDFGDTDCSGAIVKFTLMERVESGTLPATLDWRWQEIDARRRVVAREPTRCVGCHAGCTEEAGGYLATCAVP